MKPAILFGLLAVLLLMIFWWVKSKDTTILSTQDRENKNTSAKQFDKSKLSVNDPASLWVVVNKGRRLENNYIPDNLTVPNIPLRLNKSYPEMQLRPEASKALEELSADAVHQNVHFMLASGYRSYSYQIGIYSGYVRTQGQTSADKTSARPGYSEHQTGLAADVEPYSRQCEVEACFGDTLEGKWLATNSFKYGFIIRYPQGKESLTGYEYEPWHIRYVGKDLALQVQRTGQTLEQFFRLDNFSSYPLKPKTLSPN